MKNPRNKVLSTNYNYTQWVAVLSVFLLYLQMGLFIGWASPNFARLISEESLIEATTSDLSWIASLTLVGSAVGAIFGSILIEYIGSRKLILLMYLFISASWICLLVANSIEWIYASRIIGAMPCAMIQTTFSMYLGEISSPEIRGTLISLASTGSPVGTVLSTTAETYLPMKISNSLYLAAATVGIMLILWLKDTPYYFVKKKNLESATKSIKFYHSDKETESELRDIKSFVEKNKNQNFKDGIRELRSPVLKRSLIATFILWGLPCLSGYFILLSYMQIILKNAKFDWIKPEEFVIYATVTKALVAFAVVKLVDKLGRKFLIMISSAGTSISMFALGLHFYLLTMGFDGKNLQWLPAVSIIMYIATYLLGFATVPGTVLSEIFPEKVKSTAVFLASISNPLFGFIVTKAYQPIVNVAGHEFAFWIHSLLALLGIPCAVFLMIETKGKSFQEIQNELIKKWQV